MQARLSVSRLRTQTGRCLFALLFALLSPALLADTYNLYVQPLSSSEETIRTFTPLADYLSSKTGHNIQIKTASNFFAYWQNMRNQQGFDLVLDAAHFTDYRVKQFGYQVLAKVADTVSFSLVTRQDLLLLSADELMGASVATAASPSLGGVRLAQLFPNPVRQPQVVQADNFRAALEQLHNKKIDAAMVPTPIVSGDDSVNTLLTTEPVPHMALSASPKMAATVREAIKQALLSAKDDPEGVKMLGAINTQYFETASNATYQGYEKLLSDVWGYELKGNALQR
jgi:ABC-type phosphate/phosphonate transport system substrate-binding protein